MLDPIFGVQHTALAAKIHLKQREEDSRPELEIFLEWISTFQSLQLIDGFVPDPRQTPMLIVSQTIDSQHFFAVQNNAAFAFNKEGVSGIRGTCSVRFLRMRRGVCQIQHVRGTSRRRDPREAGR